MTDDSAPDELTITVGAKEIYDKLIGVDNKVENLLGQNLEHRVTALEKWRYATGGAIGLGITAIGWILQTRGGS